MTSLIAAAGYAVQGFADPWRAHKIVASRRFDLAIIGSTDAVTRELVAYLGRCAPPVKVLELDGMSRRGNVGRRASDELQTSLLSAVEQLIGPPGPTAA
ncbi:MAG: hypothetical protein ACXVDD_25550 [Polyangia bacterium]